MKNNAVLIDVNLNEIIPYSRNNKVHKENDIKEIAKSIEKNWYVAPIIVDEKNIILAWHGRALALQLLKIEKIKVLQVKGLTEQQKRDYRIRDNTTNMLSGFDIDNLKLELEELGDFSVDILDHLSFDLDLKFFKDENFSEEKEDEVPSWMWMKTQVELGDIFQLWDHFLMCWDATDKKDVNLLMAWNKAQMIFTDPPYNVNYVWDWKNTSRGIKNDNMSDNAFRNFLLDTFKRYQEIIDPTAWVYVFHSTSTQAIFEETLTASNFEIKNQLIWNKPSASMGWWDYRWKHEPFFYCSQKGSVTKFYWDRTHTTVIDTLQGKSDQQILNIIKRAREAEKEWKGTLWTQPRASVSNYVHPTQKPVGLIEIALFNSSKVHDTVVDLFWGSWSTLIACEKKQRSCRMMEMDPTFVQIIIKRYHEVTNWTKPIECLNRKIKFNFL